MEAHKGLSFFAACFSPAAASHLRPAFCLRLATQVLCGPLLATSRLGAAPHVSCVCHVWTLLLPCRLSVPKMVCANNNAQLLSHASPILIQDISLFCEA